MPMTLAAFAPFLILLLSLAGLVGWAKLKSKGEWTFRDLGSPLSEFYTAMVILSVLFGVMLFVLRFVFSNID